MVFAVQQTNAQQSCGPNDPPIVVDFIVEDGYCEGDEIFLSTTLSGTTGTFTTANGGITNFGDGTATFIPTLSGGSITFTVNYNYFDSNSGCTYIGSSDIEVYETPTGTLSGIPVPGIDPQVCAGDVIEITGNPPGGSFASQAGLIDNGDGTATFTAPLSGAVATFDIEYTFTDPVTGCQGSALGSVLVFDCSADCPSLFNSTVSSNVACSGDNVLFNATLLPIGATNATITVTNGATSFDLMSDMQGNFTGSTNVINNTCAPIVDTYTITVYCDDGSVSAVQNEDITIYPNDLAQFITAGSPDGGCTVGVTVNPSCVNAAGTDYLQVIGSSIQGPAAAGDSGFYTFCFDYFSSSSTCVDDFCLDIPYNCMEDDCVIDAGTLSGNAFVCFDEFVVANSIGSFGIDAGSGCVLNYVLHDGASPSSGTVYGTSPNGLFTNDGSYPTNEQLCVTAVASCTADAACYDESNCLPVVFMDPITFNVNESCDINTGITTVSFSVNGGGPGYLPAVHTFAIQGSYNNPTAAANTVYSFTVAPGASYTIDIADDGKGCSAIYTGIAQDCQVTCSNNAGAMSQALQTGCFGEFVNAPTMGANVQAGSVLTYVIHNGQFFLGTIYGTSSNGVFNNVGGIPTNVDLYISAVVAPLDANGQPDLTNACADIALPGTPVRFYNPIQIISDFVCNEQTGEYTVTFTITGGGPDFPGSDHTYNVSGVWFGQAESGVTYTSSPISDGDTYTINVSDDGKGCSHSQAFGPVACEKLPIELISYDGEVLAEGNYLKWVTATEINNDFFTLERSSDLLDFELVETIAGSGNTTVDVSYDYLDRNAPSGTSYYRLSQTDYDGTTVVAGVVELTRGEYQFDITSITPNPVNDIMNVFITSNIQSNVQISVVNAIGQVLMAQDISLDFDVTQHSLDLVDLPTGVYVVQIVNNDYVVNKKFMKN